MIQSNTGYIELFEATTLAACIADNEGNIVLRSRAAGDDMVCPPEGQKIIRPDGMRISSARISGGYAVWMDNVRPLTELREKLSENKAEMEKNKKNHSQRGKKRIQSDIVDTEKKDLRNKETNIIAFFFVVYLGIAILIYFYSYLFYFYNRNK